MLSEKEAEGYWGPGVFLTTGDNRAPWTLTQRAAYWAGGLNPLERGDPLAITGSVDHLVENIQKAACLQMMYDRQLEPHISSPMMLPVDPERMTPLIRGLPDSLKPIGIQLQGKIQNMPETDRVTATLERAATADRTRNGRKVWTWGEVAHELINYGRKYGPVSGPQQRTESKVVRVTEVLSPKKLLPNQRGNPPQLNNQKQNRPSSRLEWWQLGLSKGIPRELMDGLPIAKLELLVKGWGNGRQKEERPQPVVPLSSPSAPPLIDFENAESGTAELKKQKGN